MKLQAVVFDFDGLILDTEAPEFAAWQEVFRAYGAELPLEVWTRCVGTILTDWTPAGELIERTGQPLDPDQLNAEQSARFRALLGHPPRPLPGVPEILAFLKKRQIPFAIASNSRYAWVDGFLRELNLRHEFKIVVTRDVAGAPKPDPTSYRMACAGLDIAPQHCLALEDSPNGVTAALNAGLTPIAVPNAITTTLDLSHAHAHSESLLALLDHPIWDAFS